MPKRLIILPTFNEAENVKVLIPRIFKYIEDCTVLIVDDGSPDGTAEIAKEIANNFPNLEVINQGEKGGLGRAYQFGFLWGLSRGYEDLVAMDADLSHRVRDLSNLLEMKGRLDADLVIGSRWISGGEIQNWSKGRELLSRLANRYVRLVLNLHINDSTSGFRVYSTELIKKIDIASIQSEGYCFQIEMAHAVRKAGGKIVEVPITFRERERGVSKMTKAIVFEAVSLVSIWGLTKPFENFRNVFEKKDLPSR